MPNVAITPVTRKRLGPLIRLLGSDKDGEVLATVEAIKRTLASDGADLHDLAVAISQPPPPPAPRPAATWRQQAERLLRYGQPNDWERKFLQSLLSFVRPSPKQLAILERIASANAQEAA
jgi:hypothetical protein